VFQHKKSYNPELQTMNLNKALHFICQSWILLRVKNVILGRAPWLNYGYVSFLAFFFGPLRYDPLTVCLFNGVAFKLLAIFSVVYYDIL
jgi:hypothetical protein